MLEQDIWGDLRQDCLPPRVYLTERAVDFCSEFAGGCTSLIDPRKTDGKNKDSYGVYLRYNGLNLDIGYERCF